ACPRRVYREGDSKADRGHLCFGTESGSEFVDGIPRQEAPYPKNGAASYYRVLEPHIVRVKTLEAIPESTNRQLPDSPERRVADLTRLGSACMSAVRRLVSRHLARRQWRRLHNARPTG